MKYVNAWYSLCSILTLNNDIDSLQESERKAYNPRNFCKVYTMDKQPLNTGEQKDMAEFFTDLISKLEEMGPQLKTLVKGLFGGVITNNVVSLVGGIIIKMNDDFPWELTMLLPCWCLIVNIISIRVVNLGHIYAFSIVSNFRENAIWSMPQDIINL